MNNEEKKRLTDAVRLWCVWRGFEELRRGNFPGELAFKTATQTVGFVLLETQTDKYMYRNRKYDMVYAVVRNTEELRAARQTVPTEWGILCYGDPYEMGYIFQMFHRI